jgi:transposase
MRINGVATTKVVEKLGTVADLKEKLDGRDPIEWAEEYVAELTRLDKEGRREINIRYSPVHLIEKNEQRLYSGGYLFLQRIYHDLGIDKISKKIAEKHKFENNMDSILSRLIYSRMIFPNSQISTYELSKKFLEKPRFESRDIHKALEVIGQESDYIQGELYKRSAKVIERKTDILYFDFTNYFFEIEQEDLRQYGYTKEHRPNPIVRMGLFMDGDGFPLAFSIQDDNSKEQTKLKPLEKKILSEFKHSKFVVCTDSGLSSEDDNRFNGFGERTLITSQSVKKLKRRLREWAFDSNGWSLVGEISKKRKLYNISKIDEDEHKDSTFYKEQLVNEDNLKRRLIVTYSIKCRDYQRRIRDGQILRAEKLIATNSTKPKKTNQTDSNRLIDETSLAASAENGNEKIHDINVDNIVAEEAFDGFCAVYTNSENDIATIVKANNRRWEVEECFRLMKRDFKAQPAYVKRDERIKAHFLICFASLLIHRILEKRLNDEFSHPRITKELSNMYLFDVPREGYIPAYIRTDFTDALHDAFGFRTDYRILTLNHMKSLYKSSKK